MTDLNDHDAAAIRDIGLGTDNAGPTAPMKPEPVKTLRDEIAIAAMQGLLMYGYTIGTAVSQSYDVADAMLRAREDI